MHCLDDSILDNGKESYRCPFPCPGQTNSVKIHTISKHILYKSGVCNRTSIAMEQLVPANVDGRFFPNCRAPLDHTKYSDRLGIGGTCPKRIVVVEVPRVTGVSLPRSESFQEYGQWIQQSDKDPYLRCETINGNVVFCCVVFEWTLYIL